MFLPVSLAIPGAPPAGPPAPRTTEEALDRALDIARRDAHAPGATAAVFRRGRLVWSSASGVRSLKTGARLREGARFIPASTAKTVTAAMAMTLVEQGRLSLDDRVSRFLPRLRGASGIRVRQLLDHSSGLPDYLDDGRITRLIEDDPDRAWTRREILAAIRRLPRGRPGPSEYSNTNYIALGGVIERVTGRRIEEVFRSGVAERAGVTRSSWRYRRRGFRSFAHPYVEQADGSREDQFVRRVGLPTDYWGEVWTDGGIGTTARDLGRFFDALFSGRIVSEATLARMTDFEPDGFGLGLLDRRFAGRRWLGHDGTYDGYTCEAWHDPASGITVVALANFERAGDDRATPADVVWRGVAKAYGRLRGS